MVLISLKSKFKALPLAPEKWSGRNQGTMGLFFKEFSKEKHYSWLLFSSPKDRIDVLKCRDSFLYILRILPKQESIKVGCVCVCVRTHLSPTLCNTMAYSPSGSSVHCVFQARILEWVTVSSSRGSSRPMDQTHISCVSCIAGGFFTCWAFGEAQKWVAVI